MKAIAWKVDAIETVDGEKLRIVSGGTSAAIGASVETAVDIVTVNLTADEARRLGRTLLQHAARINLTRGPSAGKP